jgi:hypothetical protein
MTNHFKFISFYDNFEELKLLASELTTEEWKYFTNRQTIASENVYTIPLIFPQKSELSAPHKHLDYFSDHIKRIESLIGMRAHRAILVKLPSSNEIRRHMDRGEFLQSTHRIHLPISTNSLCIFTIGEEQMVIPEGQLWEVNNTGEYHSVKNGGDSDRVHLIIDAK